jgi:hypothetical protein
MNEKIPFALTRPTALVAAASQKEDRSGSPFGIGTGEGDHP